MAIGVAVGYGRLARRCAATRACLRSFKGQNRNRSATRGCGHRACMEPKNVMYYGVNRVGGRVIKKASDPLHLRRRVDLNTSRENDNHGIDEPLGRWEY